RRTPAHVELFENAVDVVLHGRDPDPQVVGDFLVRETVSDQGSDLPFAPGERVRLWRLPGRKPRQSLAHERRDFGRAGQAAVDRAEHRGDGLVQTAVWIDKCREARFGAINELVVTS